ncbi:CaiB/BaiF CoA transferase family protein [Phaeovulum vinaykumarii]|uniref:Crotonobetainyl-CoA:carnitine CoA-transferase CaiB n=1 Tax=Phaeovulum vinaykumarii TaxID=407234 RepID=A0A1N7MKW7_9RHOB|nr:CaiB/BaiF CoA-transferase family protein [Phaeovulum vinaykumarii]SIS86662.1 Crotonobetainyl-CoA:carnitine CoA-transferase CaiB [Phaeovulum vinaykumarii]SOC13469.1 crotonobetainyl-CoA:carnitine CoA-transferase CaiB-like acyl-CoA transferase [Phaeovulum vinaykumarii]
MRPLEGLNVVAVEQAVAAPYCTARLADAGARVCKIERPTGDFARGYDSVARGQSSYFVWLNRGKESHVLDLAQDEGRAHLAEMIAGADVLVQNLKPGAMGRMGLDPAALCARHPRLIACSISGYGEGGPMAERKAYDLLIQAESGLASITGGPESPARVGISVVDIATGAAAHSAILEALIARGITGRGCHIAVSMFDVIADWLAVPLLQAEGGQPPARVGLSHPSIAPYGAFAAADGRVFLISIQSDREWTIFCREILEEPELAEDPMFQNNVARVQNRAETDALVRAAFARHEGAALEARLAAADVAFAAVNDMAGLSAHPHLRRAQVDTPAGPVAIPAPPALFDGTARALGPVPAIGEVP